MSSEGWLTLIRAPGIGTAAVRGLLERFPNLNRALDASAHELRRAGLTDKSIDALAQPDRKAIAADLAWLEAPGRFLIPFTDPRYPRLLAEIPSPPLALFVLGDPECLAAPQLAVVGSRNPTPGGTDAAYGFSRHLAGCGLTITSGLAMGIDAAAHRGALDAGGRTIAVTGTGLGRVYPARHRDLAHRIAEQGALISEFPPDVGARRENFPRRNRILSGLAVGTLVVEASVQSGSLITARYALEQGREVFAIPGSIHNPLAKGCHALIRQGTAKLVERAEEIWEELPALLMVPPGKDPETETTAPVEDAAEPLDEEHRQVLEALGHDPSPMETIIRRTGLTTDVVSSILLLLELRGFVTSTPGGRYARRNPQP